MIPQRQDKITAEKCKPRARHAATRTGNMCKIVKWASIPKQEKKEQAKKSDTESILSHSIPAKSIFKFSFILAKYSLKINSEYFASVI